MIRNKLNLEKLKFIEIDNRFADSRYFQLAVVLDRPDCLRDISKLRNKFSSYVASPKRLKGISTEEFEQFRNDITFLAMKYFRPSSFESVMLAAVLTGKVTLKDYRPVKFKLFNFSHSFDYDPGVTMTIVLDQFTTKKELNDLYDKEFEKYKKKMFDMIPGDLLNPIFIDLKNPDNIVNIKRDREWYWRNVNGESYAQIALSELSKEDKKQQLKLKNPLTGVSGVDSVKRAIQRYKKLLAVDM